MARDLHGGDNELMGSSPAAALPSLVAGWMAWTGAEYAVHRGVFHGPDLPIVANEHTAHHRDPLATNPWARALGHAAVAVASIAPGAALRQRNLTAAGIAFAAGYSRYELLHFGLHHRPEQADQVLRRHHDRHHRGGPRRNFGVTTTFWDRVFGTLDPT